MTDEAMIENRTFDEIAVGESASVTRTLSKRCRWSARFCR